MWIRMVGPGIIVLFAALRSGFAQEPAVQTDPAALFDGVESQGLEFWGGKEKPAAESVSFRLTGTMWKRGIVLVSVSPNKWWSISGVRLAGRAEGAAEFTLLAEKDWYRREEKGEGGGGREVFRLALPFAGGTYAEYRLELRRPHGFLHMNLAEIAPLGVERPALRVEPRRLAWFAGEEAEGALVLDCPAGLTADAETVRVALLLRSAGGGAAVRLAAGALALRPGQTALPWRFAAREPGEYELLPVLEDAPAGEVFFKPLRAVRIAAVAPRSKHWFPVGTCFADGTTADYGFSVVHDWAQIAPPLGGEVIEDPYAERLRGGMAHSVCANAVPWRDPAAEGIVPAEVRMRDADGKEMRYPSFHLPRKELAPEFVRAARAWDGHPGFAELVYNNELCYVAWLAGALVDYSPYALADYPRYLRGRYGDIGRLNARYGAAYADFAAVQAPREFAGPGPAWGDWLDFRKSALAAYQKRCYAALKQVFPRTPITPKPISANEDYFASSKGIDPWLLRGSCDVYGFDLYPWLRDGYYSAAMSADFHRTQVDVPLHCTESGLSYSRPFASDYTPLDFNCTYWPAFLRGVRSCYWFEWYASWEEGHKGYWLSLADGTLTALGTEAARMNKQVQTLAPVLNAGRPRPAQIAVLFSWADMDQRPNLAPVNAVRGAYKCLLQGQYLVDMVSWHNLLAGELPRYRALVLPSVKHLRAEEAAAIRSFVAAGGVLIADLEAGRYDEAHGAGGRLDELFGVRGLGDADALSAFEWNGETIALPAVRTAPSPFPGKAAVAPEPRAQKVALTGGAQALARFGGNEPAVVRNRFGKGTCLYFAAAVFNANRNHFYTLSSPETPSSHAAELVNAGLPGLRQGLAGFLAEQGILPALRFPAASPAWMEGDEAKVIVSSFAAEGGTFLTGLSNWSGRTMHRQAAELALGADAPRKLYYFDTLAETVEELPFRIQSGRLQVTLPRLAATGLLLGVDRTGPPLLWAEQDGAGQAVRVRIVNHLAQPLEGTAQVRVDGVRAPLSAAAPVRLPAGGETALTLELVPPAAPEQLRDRRGDARPWYVWLRYDGDARAFARVRAGGNLRAP